MELFTKTKEKLFLKEIGRKLVDIDRLAPHQALSYEQEQEFYLSLGKPEMSIPILEGSEERAEQEAFGDDTLSRSAYQKADFAKEAVRALSLIRKIAEEEGSQTKKGLISKINAKIISIGDRTNKGIDFSAVPFAYNSADGTTERKLKSAEWVIESGDYISNLEENILALYSNIGNKHARRIAKKLSAQ